MIRVYFLHTTITSHNVRARWEDAIGYPGVGEQVLLDAGPDGARVTWTVTHVRWLNPRAVEVMCKDTPGVEYVWSP